MGCGCSGLSATDTAESVHEAPRKNVIKYKIILLGDEAVGKTSLLHKFIGQGDEYGHHRRDTSTAPRNEYRPTNGIDLKAVNVKGDHEMKLDIWDTSGSTRFLSLAQAQLKMVDFVVLVYNVAKKESLETLESTWLPLIREHVPSTASLILVGNKSDVSQKRREVDIASGEALARRIGARFFEWSTIREPFTSRNIHPILASVPLKKEKEDDRFTLHDAARVGDLNNAKELIRNEHITPSSSDLAGVTPLHMATQYGKLDVVEYFVESDDSCQTIEDENGNVPFHIACREGHSDIAKSLYQKNEMLQNGENPTNNDGDSALHMACRRGHIEIVHFLKEKGLADHRKKNTEEKTPLDIALEYKHSQVVELLRSSNGTRESTH